MIPHPSAEIRRATIASARCHEASMNCFDLGQRFVGISVGISPRVGNSFSSTVGWPPPVDWPLACRTPV